MSYSNLNLNQSTAPTVKSVNPRLKSRLHEGAQEGADALKSTIWGGAQLSGALSALAPGDKGKGCHGNVNEENEKRSAAPAGSEQGQNVDVTNKPEGISVNKAGENKE